MGKMGRRLREIRKKYGMNQTELAEKLGFSRSYIAMVEVEKAQTGGFIPSLDFIRTLANRFGFSRDELEELRDSDKKNYIESKEKAPVHLVRVLNLVSAGKRRGKEHPDSAADWIEVNNEVTDPDAFALIVEGDSMEPEFREGEYVVVAPSLRWKDGDYVVVSDSEGGRVLKKIRVSGDHIVLIAENPKYEPIILEKDDDPKVAGKIIRKVKKYY